MELNKTLSPLIKHITKTYNQVNAKNVLGDIYKNIQEETKYENIIAVTNWEDELHIEIT